MRYRVKTFDPRKGFLTQVLDAADESDALAQASTHGVTALSVSRSAFPPFGSGKGPAARFSLSLFTQELLALLDAGLSLTEAIETLGEKAPRSEIRSLLEGVMQRLRDGMSFSDALAGAPAVFPPLYVATVRAAEKTGDLSPALKRYLAYQHSVDDVRRTVFNASIYPALLIIVGGIVTLYLLGFVVPKFAAIYEDSGRNLPYLSRLMLALGRYISEKGWLLLAGIVAAGAGLAFVMSRPSVRRLAGDRLWRLPMLGERLKQFQLARFYRTTGMLLSGGIPILTAMSMARGLLPAIMQDLVDRSMDSVRSGLSLSESLDRHGLTTPVSLRMLRVGERTGRMDEMMERAARFHDEELSRWVDSFMRLFGPVLMIVIGLVIGMILILLYMPIFELTGSLQ